MKAWIIALLTNAVLASSYPLVDADITAFDRTITEMERRFSGRPKNAHDKKWVKAKLSHMFKVDQHLRTFAMETPLKKSYSGEEKRYFWEKLGPRWKMIDHRNTTDLKELLAVYGWIKISEFGEEADNAAWLLVQHADDDLAFQKETLIKLAALYPAGETKPSHYAYLYDRVAIHENRPQLYGTQGRCVAGTWEPFPIDSPGEVDERRKAMGLEPLLEYKQRFQGACDS